MFGKESRIYTEEDVLQAQIDFLHHGDKPPKVLGTVTKSGRELISTNPNELKIHNAVVREKMNENSRQTGIIKRALNITSIVFPEGIK